MKRKNQLNLKMLATALLLLINVDTIDAEELPGNLIFEVEGTSTSSPTTSPTSSSTSGPPSSPNPTAPDFAKEVSRNCDLPEYVTGGKRIELDGQRARYECYNGSKLPESLQTSGGWVNCSDTGYFPEYPRCELSYSYREYDDDDEYKYNDRYERIGEMPRAIKKIKQFFAHGPIETTKINEGEPKLRLLT